jgi:endonuclease/exonuclease/phosphatase family metal-dependent hydrolase
VKIGLVTWNVGLLKFLGDRIQPVPYVEERLAVVPEQLRRLNAEIVVLQEIYREDHRQYLISRLKDVYTQIAYVREKPILGLENGLMVLSRLKLDFRLELFRANLVDEKLFDRKGFLVCRFDGGACGKWSLLNIHTTAGGLYRHPESKAANVIRARQIGQILRAAKAEPGITIIAGDFNSGPGVSEENFRQVLDAGFDSAYDLMHGPDSHPTWDPTNPLNRDGPHRRCPPQRIDHVVVRREDLEARRVVLLRCDIHCREGVVPTPKGLVTVSDHFGLVFDFEINQ